MASKREQILKQKICPYLTSSLDSTSSSLAMSPGHSPSCTENLLTRSSNTKARSTHCLSRSGSMLALLTKTTTLKQREEGYYELYPKELLLPTMLKHQSVMLVKLQLGFCSQKDFYPN